MKKTMQVHLLYKLHSNDFDVWSFEPYSKTDYVVLGSKEVEFDIPDDFDPRPAQIKALKEKQRQAAADFQAFTTETMRRIQELQALEMTA